MSKKEKTKEDKPVEASEPREAEASEASTDELSTLLQKLDEVSAEVAQQKERYLRAVADLENYRKRAIREKEEARRQANCGLLEDLLPSIDNFKLGLKSAEAHEEGKVFAEGFQMVLGQFESALKDNGLEEINPENEPFDPNFHESIAHLPHESIEDGNIIGVHRIGYKIHDRLLRPAQVVVSSGPKVEETVKAEK